MQFYLENKTFILALSYAHMIRVTDMHFFGHRYPKERGKQVTAVCVMQHIFLHRVNHEVVMTDALNMRTQIAITKMPPGLKL